MEVSPELRLTPRSSGQLLWPDYLVPIDGRWPIHALPRTPLSRLVRPAQRSVAQRLRALARRTRQLGRPAGPVVGVKLSRSRRAGNGARDPTATSTVHCNSRDAGAILPAKGVLDRPDGGYVSDT